MKQPTDEERASMARATNNKVEEMKEGIARMIQPHALPGSNGIITLALLELGIERHIRISSTNEKSARALLDGVLKKVLEKTEARGDDVGIAHGASGRLVAQNRRV
jgi:hypothetical protein